MGHLKTHVHVDNCETIAIPQKGNLHKQVFSALYGACVGGLKIGIFLHVCILCNLYITKLNVVYFYPHVFSALHGACAGGLKMGG